MKTCRTTPRFSLFDELDRGLNHLVNEVFQANARSSDSTPLSIYEFPDRYEIECDLPGVKLEDVSLQVEDGVLEISGSRTNPTSDEARATVNERVFGEFSRKLNLSREVDVAAVDAEFGHGVLKVTLPKAASVLPKAVRIRSVE